MDYKKRIIIITDISSLKSGELEPDDAQSMIRYLLYSNEFDTEGLIAAAYGNYGIKPEYIHKLINAYEEDYPFLIKHSDTYPLPSALRNVVKNGSLVHGDNNMGDCYDTEASDWIIHCADKVDDRPVWILLWGGALDVAQAIWRSQKSKSETDFNIFKRKLRVYSISDQYDSTGKWIKSNYPDIFYITNYNGFRGMYRDGDGTLCNEQWVRNNIINSGSLGAAYPLYNGKDPWGNVYGIKEGDTPSFLYLLYNDHTDTPELESWGGQFIKCGENQYCDISNIQEARKSIYKWRKDFQSDFQKRLEWCRK